MHAAAEGFIVSIANTGERYACRAQQNLLAGMEALARKGIPVGCRNGGCGVCKVRIAAGQVRTEKMSRSCVSEQEQADGFVLACRAYPQSHLSVRAIDKLARCIERSHARTFLERATAGAALSPTP